MRKQEQWFRKTSLDLLRVAAAVATWLALGSLLSLLLASPVLTWIEDQHPLPPTSFGSKLAQRAALAQDPPVASIDKPGLILDPQTVALAEGDTQSATYDVSLATQPTALVIVSIETDGQSQVNLGVLVFETDNWDQPQRVRIWAIDDGVAEGLHDSTVTHRTSSLDRKYDNLQPAELTALIEDNDVAGFSINPTTLTVAEPSGTAAFTATLSSVPAQPVSLPLATSTDDCAVQPTSLSLDSGNWQAGARATVLAVDNSLVDGERTCTVLTGPADSRDPVYDGWDPEDVVVTVQDDDQAQVLVQPTSLTISEPEGSANITLTLTSQPAFAIELPLSTSNNECSVLPTMVIQQSDTWQNQIRAVVTAVDDDKRDGDQVCLVQIGPVSSQDTDYDGYDPQDVVVTVQDDERGWRFYLPQVAWLWPPLPATPALSAIDNADGDGRYTVGWSAAPRAETYILQEATNDAFRDASDLYSGAGTSVLVEGRGASRLYYRVKARNGAGDSGWSDARQVDVLWEAEPNNEPLVEANGPLAGGNTYFGRFPSGSDVTDYYYVELPGNRTIQIRLTDISAGQNYDLVLRDATLRNIGYSAELGNQDEEIAASLGAGRYYIQVFNRSGAGSSQAYQLRIEY